VVSGGVWFLPACPVLVEPADGRKESEIINRKSEIIDHKEPNGFRNVTIIGDGGMGSVLSILLCEKGIATRMWGYDAEQLAQIEQCRENRKFLAGYRWPDALAFESRDARALVGAELIVSAVPCQYMRRVWNRLARYVPDHVPLVSVAKGIENDTLLRPTQIIADVLGGDRPLAALSGPTIADGWPGGFRHRCVAAEDEAFAREVQYTITCPWLRVYTNTDLVGVGRGHEKCHCHRGEIIDGVGGDNAKPPCSPGFGGDHASGAEHGREPTFAA
jgi:glycerol-3-phosphate dehydrogenase (NAD(P)+)